MIGSESGSILAEPSSTAGLLTATSWAFPASAVGARFSDEIVTVLGALGSPWATQRTARPSDDTTCPFQSSAFHDYHTVAIADGAPAVDGGFMRASDAPGLGVRPDMDVLGEAVFSVSA